MQPTGIHHTVRLGRAGDARVQRVGWVVLVLLLLLVAGAGAGGWPQFKNRQGAASALPSGFSYGTRPDGECKAQ